MVFGKTKKKEEEEKYFEVFETPTFLYLFM